MPYILSDMEHLHSERPNPIAMPEFLLSLIRHIGPASQKYASAVPEQLPVNALPARLLMPVFPAEEPLRPLR